MDLMKHIDLFVEARVGFFEKLREHGTLFTEKAISEDIEEIAGSLKITKPEVKQCFMNSQKMSIYNSDIEYWEGYWITEDLDIPVHHAWNVHKGKLIDTTAEVLYDRLRYVTQKDGSVLDTGGYGKTKAQYFGVRIPGELIRSVILGEEVYSDLLAYHFGFRKVSEKRAKKVGKK